MRLPRPALAATVAAAVAVAPGPRRSLAVDGPPSPGVVDVFGDTRGSSVPVSGSAAFLDLRADLESLPRRYRGTTPDAAPSPANAPLAREVFWAWDFERQAYYSLEAQLGYAGTHLWVYAEADQGATAESVAALGAALDATIIPRLRNAFGSDPLPGVDGIGPVTVLLLDIRDGYYYGTEPYISGFFLPVNEYAQADLDRLMPGQRSNEREMIYVDLDPTDLTGPVSVQTAAHEFEHLIAWNHDRDEEPWLEEGLADLAISVAGLGHPRQHVAAFLAQPSTPLTAWSGEPASYGASYLFLLYLSEQLGTADYRWLRDLVADPRNGMAAVARALPVDRPLTEFYLDFALAVFHDDVNAHGGRFGFRSLDFGGPDEGLPAPSFSRHPIPSLIDATVEPWSLRADGFSPEASGLVIEVSTAPPTCIGASVRAMAPSTHPPIDATVRCTGPGRPAALAFPPAGRGGAVLVQAVLANGSDTPLVASISAPGATGARSPRRLYLPLTITD